MRLRPSGNQGPVATSWPSFQAYQTNDAWLWEHLALVRADVVAGPTDLAADVEAFRKKILAKSRTPSDVMTGLQDMRTRIAEAKSSDGIWDAKIGPGRLQDIELFSQAQALLAAYSGQDVAGALAKAGTVDAAMLDRLRSHYELVWNVQMASRLLTNGPLVVEEIGNRAEAVLLRAVGPETLAEAEAQLEERHDAAAKVIDAAIAAATA